MSGQELEQAAQGSDRNTVSERVQKVCGCGTKWHGLVVNVVMMG